MIAPLFRVGMAKTELLEQPETLREGFARDRALLCHEAIGPDMLGLTMRLIDQASFEPQEVEKLGDREVEAPERAGPALVLALRRSNLLEWLDRATGCGPLDAVMGRVVQARAGHGHRLSWHDDRQEPRRRLAVTINLGAEPYEGGLFEIRRKKTHEPVFAHRHTEAGTALIFDVARDIQHRVQPVTAGGPRRIFAGWFLAPEGAEPR
jgi:hypothetical protein